MKLVIDTNVLISGALFTGPPNQILKAWRDGRIRLVISADILAEYQRVAETLTRHYPGLDLGPVLDLLTVEAELILAPVLSESICQDPEDDKFLACALAAGSKVVVSGDGHLLRASGYRGIEVVRPRAFVERYLRIRPGT